MQLAKIEELTLYAIQQQKTIEQMKSHLKVADDLARAQMVSQISILARLAQLETNRDTSH